MSQHRLLKPAFAPVAGELLSPQMSTALKPRVASSLETHDFAHSRVLFA